MRHLLTQWNPQLRRELKGYLKPRNILIAVALSILVQTVIIAAMLGALPKPFTPDDLRIETSPYLDLTYDYDEAGNATSYGRVERVSQNQPVEPHDAYPDLEEYTELIRVGDRIEAVNGISLSSLDELEDEDLEDRSMYERYTHAIQAPFSRYFSPEESNQRNALRSLVPGATVNLRVDRPDVGQIDIELPLLVVSTVHDHYCVERPDERFVYHGSRCTLVPGTDTYGIRWTTWYHDIFWDLSVVITMTLLGLGCFWLIGNMVQEEKRGTLDFVRLSPQSAWTILGGKMLGVPSLLYLAVGLVVPGHLLSGLAGDIPLIRILSFDVLLGVSCLLYFSGALLFAMVCHPLGGLAAWLGGGTAVLIQIIIFQGVDSNYGYTNTVEQWISLFSPLAFWHDLPILQNQTSFPSLETGNWYGLAFGGSVLLLVFMIGNYSVWSGWIWRSLRRRFYMPNATLLSKVESYWLTLCFEVVMIGFVWNAPTFTEENPWGNHQEWIAFETLPLMLGMNLLFIGLLLVALTPQRQSLYDWARYRHLHRDRQRHPKNQNALWHELLVGEKSPALVAIAINSCMMMILLILWMLRVEYEGTLHVGMLLLSGTNLVILYAGVTQLILFSPWQRRSMFALGAIAGALMLPPVGLFVLESAAPTLATSSLWLLTFPWAMEAVNVSLTPLMIGISGQVACMGVVSGVLVRQLRKAGESDSKEWFSEKPSVLAGEG